GKDLTFELAEEITVDKATASTGFYIVGGPSITIDGIDMADKRITNLAPGVDPKDAVNMSQLGAVELNVDNLTGRVDGVEQNIADLSDRAVKYDGAVGSPKDTITLEGANGTKITNLADGQIAAG